MMCNNPKVGDYVYRHCKPQQPGVIRTVDGKDFHRYFIMVHVQWLDGQITPETTSGLKDFNALIADHEKKLATHKKTLAKLQEMPWTSLKTIG